MYKKCATTHLTHTVRAFVVKLNAVEGYWTQNRVKKTTSEPSRNTIGTRSRAHMFQPGSSFFIIARNREFPRHTLL